MLHSRVCSAMIVGILLSSVSLALGQEELFPADEDHSFRRFTSSKDCFSVEMPGTPKRADGVKDQFTLHNYSVDADGVKYVVFWLQSDVLSTIKDPNELIKQYRSQLHEKARIADDKEIALGKRKIPGREYRVVIGDHAGFNRQMRERVYVDGNRLYMVAADIGFGGRKYDSPEVKRFFDSFNIMPQQAAH